MADPGQALYVVHPDEAVQIAAAGYPDHVLSFPHVRVEDVDRAFVVAGRPELVAVG